MRRWFPLVPGSRPRGRGARGQPGPPIACFIARCGSRGSSWSSASASWRTAGCASRVACTAAVPLLLCQYGRYGDDRAMAGEHRRRKRPMIALWRLSNSQDQRPREAAGPLAWPRRAGGGAGMPVRPPCSRGWPRPRWRAPAALPRHYFLLEVVAPESTVQTAMRRPTGSPTCSHARAGHVRLARAARPRLLRVPSAAGGLQYLLNAEHPQLAQPDRVGAGLSLSPHSDGWTAPCWTGPAGWSRPGRGVAGRGLE